MAGLWNFPIVCQALVESYMRIHASRKQHFHKSGGSNVNHYSGGARPLGIRSCGHTSSASFGRHCCSTRLDATERNAANFSLDWLGRTRLCRLLYTRAARTHALLHKPLFRLSTGRATFQRELTHTWLCPCVQCSRAQALEQ